MALYAVTYDLNSPGQNYPKLIDQLRSVDHFHAQKSMWLINVNQTVYEVRNALGSLLDANDKLFVAHIIKGSFALQNMADASKWIEARGG